MFATATCLVNYVFHARARWEGALGPYDVISSTGFALVLSAVDMVIDVGRKCLVAVVGRSRMGEVRHGRKVRDTILHDIGRDGMQECGVVG